MSPFVFLCTIVVGTCIALHNFGMAWFAHDRVRAVRERTRVELRAKGFALVMATVTTGFYVSLMPHWPWSPFTGALVSGLLLVGCVVVLGVGVGFAINERREATSRTLRVVA